MKLFIVGCAFGLSLLCSSVFAAVVITPTIRYNQPTIGGYLVGGSYTVGAGTTSGIAGEIIGTGAGAASDTAAVICGSAFRVILDVIFSPAMGTASADSGVVAVFDNSVANAPRLILSAVKAGPTAGPLSSTAFTALAAVGRFIAICK